MRNFKSRNLTAWVSRSWALALVMIGLLSVPVLAANALSAALEWRQPGDDPDAYWDALDWSELSAEEQALWAELGWDEANWQGESDPPSSEFQNWEGLSEAEQEAAGQLGYTQEIWDATSVREPDDDAEEFWNGLDWDQLYPSERALWGVLGWDAASWSEETAAPASEYKNWDRLSEKEIAAAEQLGYGQGSWDASGPTPEDDPDAYWDVYDWDELLPEEQTNWLILGWNSDNWAGDIPSAFPASEVSAWGDLIAEEQAAAEALGYNEESWDATLPRVSDDLNTFWNDLALAWDDLYASEQLLWGALGWDAGNWDVGSPPAAMPATEGVAWAELTDGARATVQALGYTEELWDEATPRGSEGDPNELWTFSDITWDDLKFSEQRLWGILGWSADNWDAEEPAAIPVTETTPWDQLQPVERTAATELGYDEESWDAIMPRQTEDLYALWNDSDLTWDDLLFSEMRLWGLLGWDADNWDGTPPAAIPASETTLWAQLTPVERAAAEQLGYDEENWNAVLPRQPEGDVEVFWDGFDWAELEFSEMRLWGILGWNEASWDGEADAPASELKDWDQLSAGEQAAATQLGYDQALWDAIE